MKTYWETVRALAPDEICLVWVGVKKELVKSELIFKRSGWRDLAAVKHNRIHVLEESLFCRPSIRLIFGLQKLAASLHPAIYPNYDEKDLERMDYFCQ